MANLGSVYMSSGNDAAALPRFREALERLTRFLGPDHPDVASVWTGEAGALLHLGRADEAEAAARRGLEIRLAKFPETSIPVSLSRLRLGEILTARKRYPEADDQLRRAADNLKAVGAGGEAFWRRAVKARIELDNAWGKPAAAHAEKELLGAESAPK